MHSYRYQRTIVVLFCALLCISYIAIMFVAAPRVSAQQGMRKLLFLVRHVGFRHTASAAAARTVIELGWQSKRFLVTVTQDCELFVPEIMKRYDAFMFYTTGNPPFSKEQLRAMLDEIRNGKGFIGIHSATDTFKNDPDYTDMIGGIFVSHPWHQKVRIIVEDKQHPATRNLGDAFEITDEIYQFRNWSRQKVHVLLSLDPNSVDITKGAREDKDYAISWCRFYGKGRVFYTALGHRHDVWQNETFRKHLLGGILWALGILKGDATPRPKP